MRLSGSTNEDNEDRSSRKHIKMQKSVKFLIKVVKLETIVIIQGNIEVLCIAYVIQNIVNLKKCIQFLIMNLTIIIILS